MTRTMEREFEKLDMQNYWQQLYSEIQKESPDYPHRVAKFPENRNRNRYRNVSPYDHSRVKLQDTENDYINASFVVMEEAHRRYILTQGPLPNTRSHFWLMVWQQGTEAIVMLSRLVEQGKEKCVRYWPAKGGPQMLFRETGLSVELLTEEVKPHYTEHRLRLRSLGSGQSRAIAHFHYTTWPDFGVPESPASLLHFLSQVRVSGSLKGEHGPPVVHCSAGVGRSGTFSFIDICLILMAQGHDITIKQVLLKMRKYRRGLIQTPEQLRFSYRAIIEGAQFTKGDWNTEKRWRELSKENVSPAFDRSPTTIKTETYNSNKTGLEEGKGTRLSSESQAPGKERRERVLRERVLEDRQANTAQRVPRMEQRLNETQQMRKTQLYWQHVFTKIGVGSVLVVGILVGWTLFFQQNAL
ncbi:tyrosine-protein phosphatase non-receptor type 2-like [Echinops telfairi]|uniref:Tyrosine-protein phosphatase non-receptor type 2-like n=1 Tax=Echinops telfairi TaxID=9371 RepID=A0AC55CWP2_ECHTE|nr:tyrosine-protein phosphatase non-receptor type 2-like [Echinops telfairi]